MEKSTAKVIPKGKLVTNIAKKDGFANNGTIYLYTTSNYEGTSVSYKYSRSYYWVGWNSYKNGTATNTSDITLSGINEKSTIYIQYTNGKTTYRGSFTLSDALDDDGVNITLNQ